MIKRIEFYEDNAGGLYVAIIVDGEVIYTADGLEYIKDDHPHKYISLDADTEWEMSWERGVAWRADDAPSNEEAYAMINEWCAESADATKMIAVYEVNTYTGTVTAEIDTERLGGSGELFMRLGC